VAPVVANYARALSAAESVVFAIAATGELDAVTLGKRIERALLKAGIDPQTAPDIEVSDVVDTHDWRQRFALARCLSLRTPELDGIDPLPERSRSGIARVVRTMAAVAV
jgi:phage-related baseplate assembly protein